MEREPVTTNPKWLDWYAKKMHVADEYISSNITVDKFSVDLVIPYITVMAQTRLSLIPYVKMPRDVMVLHSFAQLINVNQIPAHILTEFKRTFQYHPNITAIYFDHKIADAVSTFNKIYMLAPLFNCPSMTKSMCFIENCMCKDIPERINIYEYHMDIEHDLEKPCPPTFYRNISYTLNGNVLDANALAYDLLNKPLT
jgi:hypothetical protein